MGLTFLLGNTAQNLAPTVTFGITLLFSNLSLVTVFTSLSIIALISQPLANLVYTIPTTFTAIGSFERIQTYIEKCSQGATKESYHDDLSEAPSTQEPPPANQHVVASLRGASFSVPSEETPLLSGLDLSFMPSSLTIILGKVGSGKSVLLQALLGHFERKGNVILPSVGVAYCAQSAWLVNATVRDNILGPEKEAANETWYQEVITACALDEDFSTLSAGDRTSIGSKGMALSGGQKLRIALARALYQKRPLLIADDVLSGLDNTTQGKVWSRIFSTNGLLRKQKTTVILATHNLRFLEQADNIVVLEKGQIVQQGTFDQLKDKLDFPSLRADADEAEATTDAGEKPKQGSGERDEAAKELESLQHAGDTSLYVYYLRSVGLTLSLFYIVSVSLFGLFTLSVPLWLRFWTEASDRGEHVDNGLYYGIYVCLEASTLLILGVALWTMFVRIIPKSAENLHWILLSSTLKAPLSFFTNRDAGDLVNRFDEDMSMIDRELPTSIFIVSLTLLMCINNTALVLIGSWLMIIALPPTLIFLWILQRFYLRTSQQLRILDLQTKAPLFSLILETNDGIVTVNAYGWQHTVRKKGLELLDYSQKPHYLLFMVQRWLSMVLECYVSFTSILLIAIAVLTRTTSAGGIALAMLNITNLNEVLAQAITGWTRMETSLGSIARLREFETSTPVEVQPAAECLFKPPPDWPRTGNIRIEHLSASYSEKEDAALALQDVSLEIPAGQKVAICGRTGSGKSSLLLTIFKLLDHSGSIKIDGVNLNYISPNALRSRLISVPQEPILFHGSLKANLNLNESVGASDDELKAVLKKVELLEHVESKGGIDALIQDLVFSHGQKQLVCLARAILRKNSSHILVLDEAMSGVDKHTEGVMVKLLEEEFKNHTVISVAHRLATVRKFDKMVVLSQGKVSKIGSPSELLTENDELRP